MTGFMFAAAEILLTVLVTASQILTAGVAITTLGLLIYTFTFNLTDKVARSFAALMLVLTVMFVAEVLAGLTAAWPGLVEVWLRLQWVGLVFVPAIYMDFSDGLLATTGQPSRGRRLWGKRIAFVTAGAFLLTVVLSDAVVRGLVLGDTYQSFEPGPLLWLFILYYLIGVGFGLYTIYRAYRRCLTRVTRTRMAYLVVAAAIPPVGVFPFLLVGPEPAGLIRELLFFSTALGGNFITGTALVVMSYSVAFFGAPQPDRVIKSRLFAWLLRGPVTTSTVLTAMVLSGRVAAALQIEPGLVVASAAVVTLLGMQYGISTFRRPLESLLFSGGVDRDDLRRTQQLTERLLTADDVREFLETVVAAVCDVLRTPSGFIASVGPARVRFEVRIGPDRPPHEQADTLGALELPERPSAGPPGVFAWEGFWVMPLYGSRPANGAPDGELPVVGLLGWKQTADHSELEPEVQQALALLAARAERALEDRRLQRQVLSALDDLLPQVARLQQLRAAARYSARETLTKEDSAPHDSALVDDPNLSRWVKDALSHYWGGPSLNDSPLLGLQVVVQAQQEAPGENPSNALRTVLRRAIEQVRPTDETRKFTGEWLLYNILELKFLQNRRVRDVALRLSMSEADLYRKQRVAIDQVARIIAEMERDVQTRTTGNGPAPEFAPTEMMTETHGETQRNRA